MLYTSRNQQEHSKPRCCLRLEAGTAPTLWGEKVITGTLPYIPGATRMSEGIQCVRTEAHSPVS